MSSEPSAQSDHARPGDAPGRGELRYGWTTGACATAAAKAAFAALVTGDFPDPVEITLPRGKTAAFALATHELGNDFARAGIVKDAGDDPDVTHGALIEVTIRPGAPGSGIAFRAGEGVGTVTLPGLPISPGEPAVNPVPRRMIATALEEIATATGAAGDLDVEIAIPGGEALAAKTLNGRLGVVGGLSILGTTGIVVPYSCAAWIASIHRGIDVARAAGHTHIAAATGDASERAVARHHALPETALIDMGDFVGGMLKYLVRHPVPRLTIAGGVAKMTKLAQGMLDLHSKRGQVDFTSLAAIAKSCGGDDSLAGEITTANTAAHAFELASQASIALGDAIAAKAHATARGVVADAPIDLEVLLFDRTGELKGRAPFTHR